MNMQYVSRKNIFLVVINIIGLYIHMVKYKKYSAIKKINNENAKYIKIYNSIKKYNMQQLIQMLNENKFALVNIKKSSDRIYCTLIIDKNSMKNNIHMIVQSKRQYGEYFIVKGYYLS